MNSKNLIYCSGLLLNKHIPDDNKHHSICQIMGMMGTIGPGIGIDRTNTFDTYFKMESLYSIPKKPTIFNKSLPDVCVERAKLISSLNKPITVLWSGGIDSTCALVALLVTVQDTSQITVAFEPRAIEEYPLFFNKYIKNKLSYKILDIYYAKYEPVSDEILVSGILGGLLCGCPSMVTKNFEHRNKPWREAFDIESGYTDCNSMELKLILKDANIRNYIRDILPEQLKHSEIDIKTIADLYWWFGFSVRWQAAALRSCGFTKHLSKQTFDNIYGFYVNDDFQRWSLYNYDKNVINDPLKHKQPMKDFIYDYTRDSEYRDYKTTEPSGDPRKSLDMEINSIEKRRKYLQAPDMRAIVDNEFNNYTFADINSDAGLIDSMITPDFAKIINHEQPLSNQWIKC